MANPLKLIECFIGILPCSVARALGANIGLLVFFFINALASQCTPFRVED